MFRTLEFRQFPFAAEKIISNVILFVILIPATAALERLLR